MQYRCWSALSRISDSQSDSYLPQVDTHHCCATGSSVMQVHGGLLYLLLQSSLSRSDSSGLCQWSWATTYPKTKCLSLSDSVSQSVPGTVTKSCQFESIPHNASVSQPTSYEGRCWLGWQGSIVRMPSSENPAGDPQTVRPHHCLAPTRADKKKAEARGAHRHLHRPNDGSTD